VFSIKVRLHLDVLLAAAKVYNQDVDERPVQKCKQAIKK